ncbi:MAG TPA: MerR family transcriptional regulator [Candidatus Margulisiibacteriota bacterium]|nr:MerR family transcriptional regulator [Candidatus Margulisiibacteriota bacterium]
MSAYRNRKSAGPNLTRCSARRYSERMRSAAAAPLAESIPVGAAEIAARLRVKPQTVHTWRQRGLLPPPRWTVSGQPAWDWSEVEEWAKRTGRMKGADLHDALLRLEGVGWVGSLAELRRARPGR